MKPLSIEQALLLECIANPSTVNFPKDIDMQEFAYWLERHRLRPQLSLFLEGNESVPQEFKGYLHKYKQFHFFRNLQTLCCLMAFK